MGQESPAPTATPPTVVVSGTVAATPAGVNLNVFVIQPPPEGPPVVSASASPTATPTPSLLKKTGVKIQFLPPPMEGTISLGIYDHTGKLVRVLHKEATGDEFVAALDGYITHWDRKDDNGKPMPPGHYSAKGYMVGDVTVEKNIGFRILKFSPYAIVSPATSDSNAAPMVSSTSAAASGVPLHSDLIQAGGNFELADGTQFTSQDRIRVRLVPNPLDRDRAGSAELSVGFDATGSWLQLADGLPLKQISTTPNLKWAAMGRPPGRQNANGELVVLQSVLNGFDPAPDSYVITKLQDMMAFDCGGFDLPTPDN